MPTVTTQSSDVQKQTRSKWSFLIKICLLPLRPQTRMTIWPTESAAVTVENIRCTFFRLHKVTSSEGEKSAFLKCREAVSYCSNYLECLPMKRCLWSPMSAGRQSSDWIVIEAVVKNSLTFQPHVVWGTHVCYSVGGGDRQAGVVGFARANGFRWGCLRQWVNSRLPLECGAQSGFSYSSEGNLPVITFKYSVGKWRGCSREKSRSGSSIEGS